MLLGDTLSEARQLFYILTILLGFSLAQASVCPFKNQGERERCVDVSEPLQRLDLLLAQQRLRIDATQ